MTAQRLSFLLFLCICLPVWGIVPHRGLYKHARGIEIVQNRVAPAAHTAAYTEAHTEPETEFQTVSQQESQTEFATRKSCLIRPAIRSGKSIAILSAARPVLDTMVTSAGGTFRIHYSLRGTNAIAGADLNTNGIPDYIDSVGYYLEYVAREQTGRMGYQQPLAYTTADSSAWDVYVMEIGNDPGSVIDGVVMSGFYGLTYPVDTRAQTCDANRLRTAAFLVLDNNYSPTDSVWEGSKKRRVYRDTGMLALKVTIAHEFHHMIQYAYASDLPSTMINEMTSVWMEHRVFPESMDYLQYLKPLLASTDTRYWTDAQNAQSAGYAHAFFFQYLQERGKDSLVRRTWQNLGTCFATGWQATDAFTALDSTLVQAGSSLSGEWLQCLPLLYATGHRASRSSSSFTNAADMPLLIPYNNSSCEYTDPSLSIECRLEPFQFRLLRCVLPARGNRATDTVDALCTSTRYKESNIVSFVVSATPVANSRPLGSTPFYYRLESIGGNGTLYDTLFFANGFALRAHASPFPQPFSLHENVPMWFPLPDAMAAGSTVRVTILTPDGVVVSGQDRQVVLDEQSRSRVASWSDIPQDLSSGVYVYTVESADATITGTFVVQP